MLPIFPSSNTDFIGSAHDAGGPYLPLAGGTMLGIIYGKGGTSSRLDLTELSGSKLQYGTLSLEVATNLSFNVSGVPKVTVLASGFVGIGITSPTATLHINTGSAANDATGIKLKINSAWTDWSMEVTGAGAIFQSSGGSVKNLLNPGGNSYITAGNVGIGTTSPGARLDVATNPAANTGISYGVRSVITGGANNTNTAGYFEATGASTNVALQTVGRCSFAGNTDQVGTFDLRGNQSSTLGNLFIGDYGSGGYSAGNGGTIVFAGSTVGQSSVDSTFAYIKGVKNNSTYNDAAGALVFGTQTSGSGGAVLSTVTEKMRIAANGKVGIGTPSPTSTLQVVGDSNLGGFVVSNAGLLTAGTVPVARITGLGTMATAAATDYLPLTQSAIPTSFVDLFGTTRGVIKKLDYTIIGPVTNTSNVGIAELFTVAATLGSGGGANYYARMTQVVVPFSNVETMNAVFGEIAYTYHYGTGVVSNLVGKYVICGQIANAGAVTTLIGLHVNAFSQSTGVVASQSSLLISGNRTGAGTTTDRRAININALSNSGTITDTYGIYIGSQTSGTQTNLPFSIYSSDAGAKMYHAGNVGIGTTSPANKLHVFSSAAPARFEMAGSFNVNLASSANLPYWQFLNSANNAVVAAGLDADSLNLGRGNVRIIGVDTPATAPIPARLYVVGDGTNPAAIFNTGNVGIGTTSPAANLHINSTIAGAGIRLSQSDSVNHYTRLRESGQDGFGGAFLDAYYDGYQVLALSFTPASNKPSIIYGSRFSSISKSLTISIRGGADVMTFDNAGYVGIGTTSPSAKLQIDGIAASDPVLFRVKNGSYPGSVRLEADPAGNSSVALTLQDYSATIKYAIQVSNGGYLECRNTTNTLVFGASAAGFTVSGLTISSAGVVTAGTVPVARLSGIVPTANLGTGTANATTYLRGDQTWQPVTGGNNLDAIYNAMMN